MRKCIVCGNELWEKPLIKFSNMPFSAQIIPDKADKELDCEVGIDLNLCQCTGCGLVQFDCDPVMYYKDVIRSGGFSSTMVNLRRSQYKYLIDKYHLEGKKFIEVGCGQGEFLSVLKEFPVKGYGVEHKKDLVESAKRLGLCVEEGFVGSECDILAAGPFDVFLSFNFLEHQPDPNGMLRGIYNNLNEDAIGMITVPSLEYILEYNGYYEFIHDHLAYYTFDTLRFALEKNGFEVLEQEMVNRDTISLIVRKRKRTDVDKIAESYHLISDQINDFIDDLNNQGKRVAIWGASHQGFTLASTANLSGKIEYIIDSAPFKQGRCSPAAHIPIISPKEAIENPTDAIIIMAPGYTDEIASLIKKSFDGNTIIAVMKTKELQMYEDLDG